METTSSIQLQFRSGDDLFNNYGISIIRQVVDKSENIIQQKREELRQLVGGKYLDMLRVSDTILSMNKEFLNINSSVNHILSVCNAIDSEYVYNSEEASEKFEKRVITPERLWDAYDSNQLLQLSKDLILFKNQHNESISLSDEMLIEFPEMVMKRCVSRLCENPSTDECVPLFAAFMTTLSLSRSSLPPLSALTAILHYAKQAIEQLFGSLSLDSLLRAITYVHSLLQSFIQLVEAPEEVVTCLFPQYPPAWREPIQNDLFRSLQNWIEEAFEQISQSSREFIEQIQSISQLASVKREVRQVSHSIHESWLHALSVILQGTVSDPIERLFTMLFRDQSIAIIHACFETLQQTLQEGIHSVLTVHHAQLGEAVQTTLQKPLYQLYHDLADLEYAASQELVTIVSEESKQLFTAILEMIPQEGDWLSIAFVEYTMYQSIQTITASHTVDLALLAKPFLTAFETFAARWIAEKIDPMPALTQYLHSLKWTMRDTEWTVAVSGWKEFSLGSLEDAEEELVSVPGSCSPCCFQLLRLLCDHLDQASLLSNEPSFKQHIHTLFVSTAYRAIVHSYHTLIPTLLDETPSIASPGLLLLLFDVLFIERFVKSSQETLQKMDETIQMVNQLKNRVIETMDPVDWTLAESYMKKALDECISSVALLLGLLLPPTFDLHENAMIKSLSRNDNIIFTPIEKFTSYPISSQSMQLLLQSQLKDNWCVC